MIKQKQVWIRNGIYMKLKERAEKEGRSMTSIVEEAVNWFIEKHSEEMVS